MSDTSGSLADRDFFTVLIDRNGDALNRCQPDDFILIM